MKYGCICRHTYDQTCILSAEGWLDTRAICLFYFPGHSFLRKAVDKHNDYNIIPYSKGNLKGQYNIGDIGKKLFLRLSELSWLAPLEQRYKQNKPNIDKIGRPPTYIGLVSSVGRAPAQVQIPLWSSFLCSSKIYLKMHPVSFPCGLLRDTSLLLRLNNQLFTLCVNKKKVTIHSTCPYSLYITVIDLPILT